MQDLVAALFSFLLIEPLQAELDKYLTQAQVPVALIAEVRSCARSAAPVILDRATNDPLWAISSVFNIWIGTAQPDAVLIEAAPNCTKAVEAVRPFLVSTEV